MQKANKIILFSIYGTILFSLLFTTAFKVEADRFFIMYSGEDINPKVTELIENKVIAPLKIMHDPGGPDMFSRAFIGSVWKYELVKKPSGRDKYYQFSLSEYKGAFIIDQYKMRVYETVDKVAMEDWVNNKFIPVDEWLTFYRSQKNNSGGR